jgi:peptidoglycan/xylan/chitin deacetylase (PgdA/CDA1 family)
MNVSNGVMYGRVPALGVTDAGAAGARNAVTIVTYHYVRELKATRYPRIKALGRQEFVAQLDYLARHYTFVSADDLFAALDGETVLPPNATVLTFDDGYIDHFTTVFPLLARRGIQGWFFPSTWSAMDRAVLDVNKIQFILAAVEDERTLVAELMERIAAHRHEHGMRSPEEYHAQFAVSSGYDNGEVIFIKRMLQRELPAEFRARLIGELFSTYVTRDESAFAEELYMTVPQLEHLIASGMLVGGHGHFHRWLDRIPEEDMRFEIGRSAGLLRELGVSHNRFVMCYPHGGHNDHVVAECRHQGFRVGLTVRPGIASVEEACAMVLPRIDTNEFPKANGA